MNSHSICINLGKNINEEPAKISFSIDQKMSVEWIAKCPQKCTIEIQKNNASIIKADFINSFKFEFQSQGIYSYRVGKVQGKISLKAPRQLFPEKTPEIQTITELQEKLESPPALEESKTFEMAGPSFSYRKIQFLPKKLANKSQVKSDNENDASDKDTVISMDEDYRSVHIHSTSRKKKKRTGGGSTVNLTNLSSNLTNTTDTQHTTVFKNTFYGNKIKRRASTELDKRDILDQCETQSLRQFLDSQQLEKVSDCGSDIFSDDESPKKQSGVEKVELLRKL